MRRRGRSSWMAMSFACGRHELKKAPGIGWEFAAPKKARRGGAGLSRIAEGERQAGDMVACGSLLNHLLVPPPLSRGEAFQLYFRAGFLDRSLIVLQQVVRLDCLIRLDL